VQVRAHHGADSLAEPARLAKVPPERRRQRLAAGDLARPAVADAGVDEELQPRRLDQQRVAAELQVIVLADEVRMEPRRLAQLRGRGLRYDLWPTPANPSRRCG
jgi:hypothetical protein